LQQQKKAYRFGALFILKRSVIGALFSYCRAQECKYDIAKRAVILYNLERGEL